MVPIGVKKGGTDLPEENTMCDLHSTEPLLRAFVSRSRDILGDNLLGIYLHGSAVMGCFHPTGSDVDLLAVTEREPSDGEKRIFLCGLLPLSGETPCQGIETSVVA